MTQLKKLLDELAEEAKTYDVVELAQRRARRRRWLLPAGACAAVMVAATGTVAAVTWINRPHPASPEPGPATVIVGATPSPPMSPAPPPPASCTAEQLPVPAGWPPKAIVSGGDPTGRYIVGRGYPAIYDPNAPHYAALLWDNGEVIPMDVPGAEVVADDVNSSGEVVLTSWTEEGTVGYYYRGGTLIQLAGHDATVSAINEAGVIVGSVLLPNPEPTDYAPFIQRPAVWRSPSADPQPLGPDDLVGVAVGIDEDGTIIVVDPEAAELGEPGALTRFAPDGSMWDVPLPAGATFDVNQVRGYRAGWLVTADQIVGGGLSFYLWHISGSEPIALPGYADAVNAHGWVTVDLNSLPAIGEPFSPEGTTYLQTPEGARVDLPPLTGRYSNYALLTTYLSDDGRTVAGQAIDPTYSSPDADDVAVVWHCS